MKFEGRLEVTVGWPGALFQCVSVVLLMGKLLKEVSASSFVLIDFSLYMHLRHLCNFFSPETFGSNLMLMLRVNLDSGGILLPFSHNSCHVLLMRLHPLEDQFIVVQTGGGLCHR